MARGRSIDLKLPPTRSLTRQREFRARKAARMNQLEEDNASLKAENEALRAQVERLERQIVPPPETDLQLRQSLLIARQELDKALARFGEAMPTYAPGPDYTAHGSLGESSRSSYPPAPPSAASSYSVLPQVMTPSHHDSVRRSMTPSVSSQISHQSVVPHVYPVQPMAAPLRRSSSISIATSPVQPSAPGVPPFDPNCCGGLFDCSGLPGLPVSNTRYASEAPAHPAAVPRSTSLSGPSLRLEVPTRTGSFSGSSYDGTTIVTPTTVIPGTSLPAFGPSNPGYDLASPSDPPQQQQPAPPPQSQECCWGMVDCEAGPKPQ